MSSPLRPPTPARATQARLIRARPTPPRPTSTHYLGYDLQLSVPVLDSGSPLTHPSAGPHSGRRSLVQSDIPPRRGHTLPTPESFHAVIIKFLDSAETAKRIACCPACQSPVEYQASWLIFEGRSWNMARPVCPMCNAKPHRA